MENDERARVARRLRKLEQGVVGALIPTGELAKNILRAIDYGYSDAMTPYGCLADLIEPQPITGDTSDGAVRRNDKYCSHCGALVIGDEDGD